VVHRDLKPANVKLTEDGRVKVLDFGLAKALDDPASSASGADIAKSPTFAPTLQSPITGALTGPNVILGTAAYMSPEQARGKPLDRRTDIFSFGCVFYEMLAGSRTFDGETVSDVLARILEREPDWSALPDSTPGRVRRILRRCLEKDPRKRQRDMGDVRIALEEMLQETLQAPPAEVSPQTGPPARSGWLARAPWVVATAAVAVAAWVGLSSRPGLEQSKVMRFALSVQDQLEIEAGPLISLAVSPDGNHVVLVAESEAGDGLYLRSMGRDEAVLLGGTAGASNPVFSPDGNWIAFAQGGELKKISVSGGPPVTLCDAPGLRGASWGTEGQIALAPNRATGLMLVAESGGTPVTLTELEPAGPSLATPSHRWPEFLPDGKTVLFTRTPDDNNYDIADIVAVSLTDGSQKVLIKGGTFPRYVARGFLVFLRQSTLFAARFSPERLELLGPPAPVLEGVAFASAYGTGQLSFSHTGLLTYLPDARFRTMERLVWLDRQGRRTSASAHERMYQMSRISPDGRRAVLQIFEPPRTNLWVLEFSRDSLTRFTFDELTDRYPVWSPDGNWVAYASFQGGASSNIFRKRSNGTGEAERLTQSPDHQNPVSWSPDGTTLAFEQYSPSTGGDILLLRLDPEPREPEVYLRTPFNENHPQISTDGTWVAYVSDESGQSEVYVRPLSGTGGQVKVSLNGGQWPVWSRDGKELIYHDADARKLMAVRFAAQAGEFVPELAREMMDYPRTQGLPFDVTGEPLRILTDENLLPESESVRPPKVVVHWFDELEQKVPAQ
jgi:serine/threonine-protein kinase